MQVVEKMNTIILKYFEMIFLLCHILGIIVIYTILTSGSTIKDVYLYFGLSALLAFILLQMIKLLKLEKWKLQFLLLEISLTVCFLGCVSCYTYSLRTFFAFVVMVCCVYLLYANKFVIAIPILSALAEIFMLEYVVSYFQVFFFVLVLKIGVNGLKDRKIKSIIISSYGLQIAVGIIKSILFPEQETVNFFNFFDARVDIRANIIFFMIACGVVCAFSVVRRDRKKDIKMLTLPFGVIFVASLFVRDSHIFLFASYVAAMWGFFFCGQEVAFLKIDVVKENFVKIIGLVFVSKLVYYLNVDLSNDCMFTLSAYFFDYFHFGLTQRTLMGTIFYVLFGYDIPETKMYICISVFYYTLLVVLALVIYRIYKRYRVSETFDNTNSVVEILLFAYVSSVGFFNYINPDRLTYRLDMYNMLFGFLCIYFIVRNKYIFMVPFLCALALLNHQVFVFIVFAAVFIPFVYRVFIDADGKFKRNLLAFCVTLFVVGGLFVYLQFFSHKYVLTTTEQAVEMINDRTDNFFADDPNEYLEKVLSTVVFADAATHVNEYQKKIEMDQVQQFCKLLIYILPLVGLYFYSFFRSAKLEEDKVKRVMYRLMPWSILAFVPVYALEIDYGRWNAHLIAVLIIAIFVLTILQKPEKKWYKGMRIKTCSVWLGVVYLLIINLPLFDVFGRG